MARYPLNAKLAEFKDETLEKFVGRPGWQGRFHAFWNGKQREFADKTDGTQKQYVIKFRKAAQEWLKALPDDDPRRALDGELMSALSFPEGLLDRCNAEYRQTVSLRARQLVPVPDYQALVQTFREWMASPDVRLKALGVMALTGRRFVEVLKMGTFERVRIEIDGRGGYKLYSLLFSGQAKTRGGAGTRQEAYEVPVLAPAYKIVDAVQAIRNSPEGQVWQAMGYQELNAAESRRMNERLRGALAVVPCVTEEMRAFITIKQMRALYGEIAFAHFSPENMTKNAYFSNILGHALDDLNTSLSYMVFAVPTSRQSVEEAQAEVERLVKLQEEAEREAGPENLERDDDEELVEE